MIRIVLLILLYKVLIKRKILKLQITLFFVYFVIFFLHLFFIKVIFFIIYKNIIGNIASESKIRMTIYRIRICLQLWLPTYLTRFKVSPFSYEATVHHGECLHVIILTYDISTTKFNGVSFNIRQYRHVVVIH